MAGGGRENMGVEIEGQSGIKGVGSHPAIVTSPWVLEGSWG